VGSRAATALVLGTLFALVAAGAALATHPRPNSGTPFRVPLVPDFRQCPPANADATHTEPLDFPSCTNVRPESQITTLGTDGDGSGFVKLRVFCTDSQAPPCTPSDGIDTVDVSVQVSLSDVRCFTGPAPGCAASGADYTGEFFAAARLRLSDHANAPGAQPCPNGAGSPPCVGATMQDMFFSVVRGQCVDNGGPGGALCAATTTFDTISPTLALEGQRAVFALPPGSSLANFRVFDGGTNGGITPPSPPLGLSCPPLCGDGDDGPIASAGMFVP
jgi:hypothetical protein